MGWSRRSHLLVAGLSVALAGCHAITEETPTAPTPATPAPLAIPVILPTPKPTPKPSPTPSGGSCSLPPSNPANPSCTDESPLLLGAVDKAITAATTNRPDLFDFDNKKCDDCYYVKNVDGYVSEVIKHLNAQSVCGLWDGEELAVKKKNDWSEQYDILLASGHIRRGAGSYQGICRPAWF
jgi:hypothetical protein